MGKDGYDAYGLMSHEILSSRLVLSCELRALAILSISGFDIVPRVSYEIFITVVQVERHTGRGFFTPLLADYARRPVFIRQSFIETT